MDDLEKLAKRLGARVRPLPSDGKTIDIDALLVSGIWRLQDIPWVPEIVFDAMITAAGDENVHLLARTTRGTHRRGQLLISDVGRENIKAAREKLAELFRTANTPNMHPTPDRSM